jgi:hypothetical protein
MFEVEREKNGSAISKPRNPLNQEFELDGASQSNP